MFRFRNYLCFSTVLLLIWGTGTAAETLPAAENPLIAQARAAWAEYTALGEALDPKFADFYDDAARIVIIVVPDNGDEAVVTEMTGRALKDRLLSALDPVTGTVTGLVDNYSDEAFALDVNGRVKMTATRHVLTVSSSARSVSALAFYFAPHAIVWRKRGDAMRIVEEHIEIHR